MKIRQTLAAYDVTAPKKSANLSVNTDLLEQAKALNINLSKAFEEGLAGLVVEEKRKRWLKENQEAIEAYNQRIEDHGCFSEGVRSF